MSLLFTNAASDRVDCGSGSSISGIGTATVMLWVYPTSLPGSSCRIWQKGTGAQAKFHTLNNDGSFAYNRNRATTFLTITTAASVITTNAWQFIAVQWNESGVNGDQKAFKGDLTTPAADVTSTQTVGSGTITQDTGVPLIIGNRSAADQAFTGRIAVMGFVARALTLGEIIGWQFRPYRILDCAGLWNFYSTLTAHDLSGNANNGTVTGATQADHVPVIPKYGFDDPGFAPYTVAAAAPASWPGGFIGAGFY